MFRTTIRCLVFSFTCFFASSLWAQIECDTRIDLLASSPVGSWQLSRELGVGRDGKRAGRTLRTSMLGQEQRDGKPHYWVETASQPVAVDSEGQIVEDGQRMVVLSLIPEPVLRCAKESLLNLNQSAVDGVVQIGNEPPIRIKTGTNQQTQRRANRSAQQITDLANETIAHEGRPLETLKLNVVTRIDNKSMKVQARSDMVLWYSDEVPFGVVKTDGTSVINGEPKKSVRELLEFSRTGATIQMTQ